MHGSLAAAVPAFPYDEVAIRLAIALGVGLLIGLEREWAHKAAGVRTFAITALLGTLTALASLGAVIVGFASVALLIGLMNAHSLSKRDSLEITTSVTLLATYVLGVLIGQGHYFTAASAAILMTLLLSFKEGFSAFAGTLRLDEIRSAVLIGLLAFVIYPLMPAHVVDPWHLIAPREAWAIVVVIAGLGFFNYVMLRLFGARGVYYAAFLGGLVNSTAAAAELSAAFSSLEEALPAAALLLTSAAMFVRNLAILAIFSPNAAPYALPALAGMAVTAVPFVWWGWRSEKLVGGSLKLASPLSLARVVKFAALFIVIAVAGTIGQRYLGATGFLVFSALGGLASSASTTATAAALTANGSLAPYIGAAGAVIASVASALVTIPVVYRLNQRSALAILLAASGLTSTIGLLLLVLTSGLAGLALR
ncbi:MAG: MgtC/SapB family protein [Candidatus Binataceae bacterium]